MPWSSLSPDLNPIEHLSLWSSAWDSILHHRQQNTKWWEFPMEEWWRIPSVEFLTLVKVQWSCYGLWWPTIPLRHFMIPLFWKFWKQTTQFCIYIWPFFGHSVSKPPNELQCHTTLLPGLQLLLNTSKTKCMLFNQLLPAPTRQTSISTLDVLN
jgi:hypothetical protein